MQMTGSRNPFEASPRDLISGKRQGSRATIEPRLTKRKRSRGTALIEFVLIFPVLMFLFFGTFDMGFYMYALVSTQSAARIAALDTSASSARSGSTSAACADVITELNMMPNAASFPSGCNALPLQVTAQAVTGPDGESASKVSVTYRTSQVIPIPGLAGQLKITRVVQMRDRS